MLDRFCRIVILGFAACLLITSGRAASFTASLDRDTITLGESATLTLRFDGETPQTEPTLPQISGLKYGNVFPNSIKLNINGVPSSILTLAYPIMPQHEGEFAIPAITATVNGQQLSTSPLKLVVAKASAPTPAAVNSGNEVAFMKLLLPQRKVYVGQTLTAQLQIYLRDDVQNYGQPQFTGTPADGLTLGKSAGGGQSQTHIGNHAYTVLPILLAVTATKSGTLTLGPFTANMVVVLPSQNQGGDPFAQFGFRSPFFNSEQKQVSLATEQVSVESLPLPEQGKPSGFKDLLAKVSISVGPTNLIVGDPVTVRVQVSGHDSLETIRLPDPLKVKGFKIIQSSATITNLDLLGAQRAKIFELVATPQNADVREWPELVLTCDGSSSYFDPESGSYHTLAASAVPLVVKAAGAVPMPMLAATKNPAPENQMPQDILPIKEKLGTLETKTVPLVAQPVFLAAQTVPVLAFLVAFIWRKRTDSLANNPRLRRQRAVAALVASGMEDLKKYAAENKPDEFFATLFRLLQEQLGERLDCPAAAITENVIEEHPVLRGAPKATLVALRELFQLCNQARYAPVRGTSELNLVAAQFEKTIGELQEVKV